MPAFVDRSANLCWNAAVLQSCGLNARETEVSVKIGDAKKGDSYFGVSLYTARTKVVPVGPSQEKQPFPPRILQVVAGSFAVELSHSKAFKVF